MNEDNLGHSVLRMIAPRLRMPGPLPGDLSLFAGFGPATRGQVEEARLPLQPGKLQVVSFPFRSFGLRV